MTRYPLGFARSLSALDFLLGKPKEIVVVGDQSAADTQALLRVVFEPFLPNKVVAGIDDGQAHANIPLLEARDATRRQANGLRVRALRVSGADH